ncbi:MAG: hypothetical protein AAB215_05105 [Planctomycetota bacterium]
MPSLPQVRIGSLSVGRLILGGNPFSGFSHRGPENDRAMRRFFTTARIKETFAQAERLGIDTFCGRADNHIIRVLEEYWDEGGKIQWLAQSAPEISPVADNLRRAALSGAKAFYIHGGVADRLNRAGRLAEAKDALAAAHDAGLPAGIAGHDPATHRAALALDLPVDFHMVCFYHPASRMGKSGEKADEGRYHPADREAAVALVRELKRPCIAYKILAAGRNDPREAIPYAYRAIKATDAVCLGVHPGEDPRQMETDVALAREAMEKGGR